MHEYSGYIFFPTALAAMLGLSKLLNLRRLRPAQIKAKGEVLSRACSL